MRHSIRTRRRLRRWLIALTVLGLVAGGGWFAARWLSNQYQVPLPASDQCTATVNGSTVTVTIEQASFAAVIAGEARRRGLAPRAVSIALATAYQESGIRNLDHGDRDSVGLFQQRPSQGWGSSEQILDPWYASGRFYAALVKIPNWQTSDLNDVAQQVQISAFPDAYRKHVERSKTLASALSGETPLTFGCRISAASMNIPETQQILGRTFGSGITMSQEDSTLTVSGSRQDVFSAVALSISTAAATGLASVSVGEASWSRTSTDWQGSPPDGETLTATLRFSDS